MTAAIPVHVINLDRRPDRLARIGAHLADRGVGFIRQSACDAQSVPEPEIAQIVAAHGPLGQLGLGDRACTVSHTRAWQAFLDSGADHALFVEDDIFLSADIAATLATNDWIPPGCHAVKLEKFNAGTSRLLLAPEIGHTPSGRALHPMRSRHVGGGAYILSRRGAELALAHRGRMRVPIDHFLFNDTVSPIRRALAAAIVVPAMATQRAYAYESDIAPLGKAIRPKGWKKRLRTLRRGLAEVNQAPRQIWQWATGQARIIPVAYAEHPPQP
jgi:glycosyl transferase family 25